MRGDGVRARACSLFLLLNPLLLPLWFILSLAAADADTCCHVPSGCVNRAQTLA